MQGQSPLSLYAKPTVRHHRRKDQIGPANGRNMIQALEAAGAFHSDWLWMTDPQQASVGRSASGPAAVPTRRHGPVGGGDRHLLASYRCYPQGEEFDALPMRGSLPSRVAHPDRARHHRCTLPYVTLAPAGRARSLPRDYPMDFGGTESSSGSDPARPRAAIERPTAEFRHTPNSLNRPRDCAPADHRQCACWPPLANGYCLLPDRIDLSDCKFSHDRLAAARGKGEMIA